MEPNCITACPIQAIAIEPTRYKQDNIWIDRDVAVVSNDCISCEQCVSSCPVSALYMGEEHMEVNYFECIYPECND